MALARPDRIGTADPVVTARFRYDPYGNVIHKTGTSDTPWRYAGGWFDRFPDSDPDAQAGLYKMGERFYDPKIGRWTQRDPVDQSTNPTAGNGYMYAGADPVNASDPSGRSAVTTALTAGAAVCGVAGFLGAGVGYVGCEGVLSLGLSIYGIGNVPTTSLGQQSLLYSAGGALCGLGGALSGGTVLAACGAAAGVVSAGLTLADDIF